MIWHIIIHLKYISLQERNVFGRFSNMIFAVFESRFLIVVLPHSFPRLAAKWVDISFLPDRASLHPKRLVIPITKGHIRLCFKTSPGAKPFIRKSIWLAWKWTYFQMNGRSNTEAQGNFQMAYCRHLFYAMVWRKDISIRQSVLDWKLSDLLVSSSKLIQFSKWLSLCSKGCSVLLVQYTLPLNLNWKAAWLI